MMMLPKRLCMIKQLQKLNNIDTSEFGLKSKYETDKSDLENKISDADKKNS